MKLRTIALGTLFSLGLVALAVGTLQRREGAAQTQQEGSGALANSAESSALELPSNPGHQPGADSMGGGVYGVVAATPFRLKSGYRHDWSAENPYVSGGWLVVLLVEPSMVHPRQTQEPVLMGGDMPLERINQGELSGHVVAILPAKLDASGLPPALDSIEFYFATPQLPEQLDRSRAAFELERAQQKGTVPFGAESVSEARAVGGQALQLQGRLELIEAAAKWISRFASDEHELAEILSNQRG